MSSGKKRLARMAKPEEKTVEEKVEEALVGVADETGLKKMIESDEETDEDEEVPDEQRELAEKINEQNDEKAMEDKQKYMDIDKRESSESESDDPDNEKIKSAIFLQKKEAKKRPVEEANGGDATTSKKAKTEEPAFEMPKAQLATHRAADVSDEEMVRSLLQRKPHSTKELLNKIGKTRFSNLSKTEIVSRLAAILKKIEPYQFRQKVGQKEVLYFSLTTNKP
uniref:Transcription initiation factor IIF subunit alpha n=1 Tax=Acrobeloides nanus TaxID=290746 RepID=A0A914DKL2_9BILA